MYRIPERRVYIHALSSALKYASSLLAGLDRYVSECMENHRFVQFFCEHAKRNLSGFFENIYGW